MSIKRLFFLACTVTGLLSCGKVDERSYGDGFKAHTPEIDFPQASVVNVSKDGETVEISFVCTRDWKAAWGEDWVGLSPSSGSGSEDPCTITLSAGRNSGYVRSASITFTAGYPLSATLVVNQDGEPLPPPFLALSPDSLRVAATETEAKFFVEANRDWVITCSDRQYSVTPVSGTSGSTEVTVNFQPNTVETDVAASFDVSLLDGDITRSFTLVQGAAGPDPNRKYYERVSVAPENFDGRYLALHFDGDVYLAMNPNDVGSVKANYASPCEVQVVNGCIEATKDLDAMSFYITEHTKLGAGWYSFIRGDGFYFYGGTEDKSQFLTKATETANGSTITFVEEGAHFLLCYRGTNPLIFHESNRAFVFIKKANAGNKDCGNILLFKRYGPTE